MTAPVSSYSFGNQDLYRHLPAAEIFQFSPDKYRPLSATTHFKRLQRPQDIPVDNNAPFSAAELAALPLEHDIVSAGGILDCLFRMGGGSLSHCETEFFCQETCPSPQLQSITIQCTFDLGTRAVQKIDHPAPEWISVSMRLSREELQYCYEYQTAAVGKPYNNNVACNMVWRMFACGLCAKPTTPDKYFCSELVAASILPFGYIGYSANPCIINPEKLFNLMQSESDWTPTEPRGFMR
jgi:hypothetical protein